MSEKNVTDLVREFTLKVHEARMLLLDKMHEVDPDAMDREFQDFAMTSLTHLQRIFAEGTNLEFKDQSKLGTGGRRAGR